MEHVPKKDDVLPSEVLQGGIPEDADGPRKATLAIRGDVCLASVGSKKTSVHSVLWGKRPPLESVSEEMEVALQLGIQLLDEDDGNLSVADLFSLLGRLGRPHCLISAVFVFLLKPPSLCLSAVYDRHRPKWVVRDVSGVTTPSWCGR